LKNRLSFAVILLVLMLASTIHSAEFIRPVGDGSGSVAIEPGQAHKNVYAAGSQVRVGTPIHGDLVVAGSTVLILAPVEQDLIAAGGTIEIQMPVGDDVRVAGGKVFVGAGVGGDLIAGAGQLTLSPASKVAGDVVIAGGTLTLEGEIAGKLMASGGTILLNGDFGGDVTVRSKQRIEVGPHCRVKGMLTCYAPEPVTVPAGASIPRTKFHKVEGEGTYHPGGAFTALVGLWSLINLVALLLASVLVLKFLPKPVASFLAAVQKNPLRNLGMGLVVFLLWTVIVLVLFLSVVGYFSAMIVAALLFLAILAAKLMTGFYMGSLLRRWMGKPQGPLGFAWVAGGIVVLLILAMIPVLGWLALLYLWLVTFGTIWGMVSRYGRNK
jgi:hypothetical protein